MNAAISRNIAGKSVLVVGLGKSGFAAAHLALKVGASVTLYDDNDQEQKYVLHAGDSVHFGKGTKRGCLNTGVVTAQMMTIMIKPQA